MALRPQDCSWRRAPGSSLQDEIWRRSRPQKELGPKALALAADTTDIAATEAAIAKGAEKFGKYDIVFANAGIAGNTPLGASTFETFERVISTNLTSVFFTVQSALPHLNDNASIILNGSVISVLGIPGYSA